jgi:hypothetical protein
MSSATPLTAGGGTSGRTDEVIARLSRAVQRATIYPEGHPAIRAAVGPFLESVRAALRERASLAILVSRDHVEVEGEEPRERPRSFGWLAQQLYARDLASITLQGTLREDEAIRFVLWLGRREPAPEDSSGEPRFEGIACARLDYTLARFREGASTEAGVEDEVVRTWASAVGSLTEGWFAGDREALPHDPEELGRELGAHIARNEGVGGAVLASRILSLGAELGRLPRSVRAAVKRRLGAFIGALSPDLQRELLRIGPDTDPARLAFVAEVLEDLPDPVVMDILAELEPGAHVPHQFITLMEKLVGLASRDPLLAEAAEVRLESMGLPRGLVTRDPPEVRAALEEVLSTRVDDTEHNPEAYQARLEELSARRAPRSAAFTEGRHGDPRSLDEVAVHVTEIALRLLVAAPASPDSAGFAKRLIDDAPHALQAGRFDFVYAAAQALRAASLAGSGPAAEYTSILVRKDSLDQVLDAVQASSAPPTPAMVGLFRLGGVEAACAAFARISSQPDAVARERLVDLLVFLEAEPFSVAVARARSQGAALLPAVFEVLRHPAAPKGFELALTFLGNKDADVRLEAFRVLFGADLKAMSFERCLEKALSDAEPRIASFGLEQARRHKEPGTVRLLGSYLEGRLGFASPTLHLRAVEVLAEAGTREARDALVAALASRRRTLGAGARAVAREIAATLRRIGDEPSEAAVRAWRRSVAGLWSRLVGDKDREE